MDSLTVQLYSPSLEVILLVIAVVAHILLAYIVYYSNRSGATNRVFALLSIVTVLWLLTNYMVTRVSVLPDYANSALLLNRLGIFFAAPMSALFFLLAHTIPSEKILLQRRTFYVIIGATLVMMALNISPLAYVGIAQSGASYLPTPGPGLVPFTILSTLFSILAVYSLIRKYLRARDIERIQLRMVLVGMFAMLGLIIATILVPIIIFNSVSLLILTPVYTLIFLGMTAYAVAKYQLFDIKILLTQALTIVMALVLFARLFGEETLSAQVIDALVLIFMIVFGFFLVRSVKREVKQREVIQIQAQELEIANKQQEGLLHFISHEIKGYLTKSEAAFAAIAGGDYGQITAELQSMSQSALAEMRKGVATIMDILDASNLKKGTVSYAKVSFDFVKAVDEVVHELFASADQKGLSLSFVRPSSGTFTFEGDEEKIRRHVIRNVIDNSIKYTPQGSVRVLLSNADSKIRMAVTDTGVGITKEDMAHLFTEGGHGKDSIKVNVHSTGYGLYIAKQIVEAHGGRIWAESDGAGRGSRFIVEFPVT